MGKGLFVLVAVVIPLSSMALFAPLFRKRSYNLAYGLAIVIFAISYFLLGESYEEAERVLRALAISALPLLAGWAYNKFFWEKDRGSN